MAHHRDSNGALCPECEGLVQVSGKLHVGQKITCRRCGATLMISGRKPLELVPTADKRSVNGHVKGNRKLTTDKAAAQSSNQKKVERKEGPLMSTTSPASMADCPECNTTLRFHKPLKVGQLVVCPECDETLEVVSLRPLELHWADEDPWNREDYDDSRYPTRHGTG